MAERILKGIPASDGIAIGPVFVYIPAQLTVPVCAAGTIDEEMSRFDKAREQARRGKRATAVVDRLLEGKASLLRKGEMQKLSHRKEILA